MKALGRLFAWLLSGVILTAAAAEPQTLQNTGCAYDPGSGRLLYVEAHEQRWQDGRNIGGTISYSDPQGQRIATKTLDFNADPFVPSYRLEIPGQDYTEGIAASGGKFRLTRQRRGEAERGKDVAKTPPIAADAGVHQFIQAKLPALMEGGTLKLRLAVAGHLDTYSVRVRHAGDIELAGRAVVDIIIEHDSVLSFVLDPVHLLYDRETRRLLEYRGTSNMRDPATGDAYTVRISYLPEIAQCRPSP